MFWLATYKPVKRPEWFLRLARELPHHRFVMAGVVPPPPLTQESWHEAVAAARELPNLEVRGFLSSAEQVIPPRTSVETLVPRSLSLTSRSSMIGSPCR